MELVQPTNGKSSEILAQEHIIWQIWDRDGIPDYFSLEEWNFSWDFPVQKMMFSQRSELWDHNLEDAE